jgi:subtilisin family serine protease
VTVSFRKHHGQDHFQQLTEKFSHHLQNRILEEKHQFRPFIVKISPDCHSKCHDLLSSTFGRHSYDIICDRIAVVSTNFHQIQSFHDANPWVLTEFVPFHPEMKISDELHDFTTNLQKECKERNNEGIQVRMKVHGMTEKDFQTFQTNFYQKINLYNGVVTVTGLEQYPDIPQVIARLTIGDCLVTETVLRSISSLPEVLWLERDLPASTHNRYAKGICDSGLNDVTPLSDHNITGTGEVVGVSDTGIDMKHCFFYDPLVPTPYNVVNLKHRKVVLYLTNIGDGFDTEESHGSHVAGTIAGVSYQNYGGYEKLSGMASGAKIAFYDMQIGDGKKTKLVTPSNLYNMFTQLAASGAKIFSNSWGTSGEHKYTTDAENVDKYMWDHPDSLILFSAGNDGFNEALGAPATNTINSPGTNKNGITVGAALNAKESWMYVSQSSSVSAGQNEQSVAFFSSEGPTSDGRLKPDLLGPGYYVWSAKGTFNTSSYHCDEQGLSGTSMATPATAGHAVKVRQYFTSGYYPSGSANASNGFTPAGALIKAMLVHSSRAMDYFMFKDNHFTVEDLGGYPSSVQGYGRFQLNRVLHFGESSRNPLTLFVKGGARPSDDHYVAFTIPGQFHTYNVTTDASRAPIRVTLCYTDAPGSTAATSAMINTISLTVTTPSGSTLFPYQPTKTTSNTQVIDIERPEANSVYRIKLNAEKLNSGPQPYALVVTGKLTYLNATSDSSEDSASSRAKPSLNYNTSVYIIILAVLVAFLASLMYYVYRLANSSILKNPKNFQKEENDFPYEFVDDDEIGAAGASKKKNDTIYQKYFQKKGGAATAATGGNSKKKPATSAKASGNKK